MKVARIAPVACVLVALLRPLFAQEYGAIQGRIVDADGDPVAGALVRVEAVSPGVPIEPTRSDQAGAFRLPGLAPGSRYTLFVSAEGYAAVEMRGVAVERGRATSVTLVLDPAASVHEEIRVQASAGTVRLDDAGAGSSFSAEVIDALPILGRNYQDLLVLAPGVTDVDGDGAPNIHGARDTDVSTVIDGMSMTDPLTGKGGIELNIESIQEVEIKTAAASAEHGRAQGGFVDIQTKSGGNQFEGTFKYYYRSSRLDGDGAGFDDPRLHGGLAPEGQTSLQFHDSLPFLSLSGPIVRDHAWYYASFERIRQDIPVNAVTQAFVTGVRQSRDFLKLSWQATTNGRLNLTVTRAPQEFLNQGLNSFTAVETGYTLRAGGTLVSGKHTAILSPAVALETTLGYLDTHPGQIPTLGQDTNGDERLYIDRNHNGFNEANERDPGEDYDRDGVFDVFEDTKIRDRKLEFGEDLDRDGRLTIVGACEGDNREDRDCDGRLDVVNEDDNGNGFLDKGEDRDGDGRLDPGTEDRNGNHLLDDTPFPDSDYPYGRRVPLAADRDQTIDLLTGIVSGPSYLEFNDKRARFTLRQDLSAMQPDFHGSHDLRFGYQVEREEFSRTTDAAAVRAVKEFPIVCKHGICMPLVPEGAPTNESTLLPTQPTMNVILPTRPVTEGDAIGTSTGVYVTDSWKPRPNLSLSLGVRFDRERTQSAGYAPFDPVAQSATVGRLLGLMGAETTLRDYQADNNGAMSLGILGDPFYAGGAQVAAPILEPLRTAAVDRFTRHHDSLAFDPSLLPQLLPGVSNGDQLTDEFLRQAGVPVQTAETFTLTNNNLAPRLAVSWDPVSTGRTKLFATWGRFYDRLFLSTIVGEQGPDWLQRYYEFDADGLTGVDATSLEGRRGSPNDHAGLTLAASAPTIAQVDRALQTPFSDEFTLGVDREVAPEVRLGVRYIQRSYRDQLQDVDLNHHTLPDPVRGGLLDQLGLILHDVLGTASDLPIPDGKPDLYLENPFFNQVLRVGNFNEARYRAIEVQASKRLSRRWGMDASYVYSRATGDAEDFQSRQGNDPSTIEPATGYLDYDQRHVVKLNGVVYLPHDWQAGISTTWSSGLPYSIVSRFFAYDSGEYLQLRTRYGFLERQGEGWTFHSEPRNSRRNDAVTNIDLRLKKSFVLGRTTGAVFLEAFNVLNSDDLTIHSYEPGRGAQPQGTAIDPSAGTSDALTSAATGVVQLDAERRFGRRLQVGFQFAF
ncbi:MAG TPA: carboxypeptidase regulatory-like domain-containing protein [Verrucomicrobiae bacterium]|nr:carboxypeptidase regulatory-like domain-containing protein [Verrucomicrobiae bacterium]